MPWTTLTEDMRVNHVTSCLLFMVRSFNNMHTDVHKTKMSFFVLVDCLNFVFYTVTRTVLCPYMVIFSKENLQPELCERRPVTPGLETFTTPSCCSDLFPFM